MPEQLIQTTAARARRPRAARRQSGFTLVEVLVSMIVFSIGMVGLAGLHFVGTRHNDSSYLRSQAALQGYSMADRMRANMVGVKAGHYNNVSGITSPSNSGCLTSGGCTPQELAQHDAYEWNVGNRDTLPSGAGTVSYDVDSNAFTITVSWDEDRDGSSDTSFAFEFQP